MSEYRHRQWGVEMIAILCIAALVTVVVAPNYLPGQLHYIVAGLLLVLAWLFSSLLITVEGGKLGWSFGPGLISYQIDLDEIRSAQHVRLRWYRGWGIRLTRNGWLYNVTGRQAVLITQKSGKRFILGCDQPDLLVRTLLEHFSKD